MVMLVHKLVQATDVQTAVENTVKEVIHNK